MENNEMKLGARHYDILVPMRINVKTPTFVLSPKRSKPHEQKNLNQQMQTQQGGTRFVPICDTERKNDLEGQHNAE